MMEKYGVSSKVEQQKSELKEVKSRLSELNGSLEKTADDTQEVARLEKRAIDLQIEIAGQ